MSFAFPWILWFLPLAFWLLRPERSKPISLSSLGFWRDLPEPPRVRWRKYLRVLRCMIFALLLLALAGPRSENRLEEEARQGIAIELLVDSSSSMDQSLKTEKKVDETRMETAKEVVEGFIESRPDDLIGLVTFARYADTLSPLTSGHRALIQLVRDLEIQDRPNEDGTAYGDALMLAAAQLKQMNDWQPESTSGDPVAPIESKILILLTDGENNCGLHLPMEAAALAREWGIRIYAISLSSSEGMSELSDAEKVLSNVCEDSDGLFSKTADREGLLDIYETINDLEKSEMKTFSLDAVTYKSHFAWLAFPALCLLLIEYGLRSTVLRVASEEDE